MSTIMNAPPVSSPPASHAPALPAKPAAPPAAVPAGGSGQRRRRFDLRRVNFRLVGLLAVVSLPFLWFLYTFVVQTVTGGVQDYGEYVKVDLKSLGYFPFSAEDGTINDVPKRWRDLNGRRVMLEGEVFSRNSSGPRIDNFELVYSITDCCFNGPPKVQERVFVRVRPGQPKVPNYHNSGIVRVVGTLHVNVEKDAGQAVSVFTLDLESIERT